MSRGLGRTQREAMVALWDLPEGLAAGVPLAELKRCISADRSNARRAIRGLVDRGMVAETRDEEGVRRVQLTGGGHLACWLAAYPHDRLAPSNVPSRPLTFDVLYDEDPLGSEYPSWFNAAAFDLPASDPMRGGLPHAASPPPPDRPVSDNGLSSRRTSGNAMRGRISHTNAAARSDSPVSDNERSGAPVMEMVAKIAREWLDRLDEDAGEDGEERA